MALPKWIEDITNRVREAVTSLSNTDVCKTLSACLQKDNPGKYCYVCDVFGDDSDGELVYYCDGCYKRCSYSIGTANGARSCTLDYDDAEDVIPRTTYDPIADDADDVTSMGEAERDEKYVERFPGSAAWDDKVWTFAERFISKKVRDQADSGSFAGKGKSFPILQPGDVKAAFSSLGRAGSDNYSTDAIKRNILKIAKKKGFPLPKKYRKGADTSEAAEFEFTGDVVALREGAVGQDGSAYLKLIAPGWGSSGYYSREVLQRDGPKIFKAGTKNFWNHPTAAEEASRPEGDLRDLASVLTEDAHYEPAGPAGEGLYARATVQPHFREHVDSLAKHIGMSIRAAGKAREGKVDGKQGPVIEQLTRGISVDYVTTPGAGGKVLQLFEAARPRPIPNQGETDMDEATIQRLITEAQAPLLAKLAEYEKPKLRRGKTIRGLLEGIHMPKVYKDLIVERVKADYPLTEAGGTDDTRLKTLVEKEVKRVAQQLSRETGRPVNLGPSNINDPKLAESAAKEHEASFTESMNSLADIFMDVNEQVPEDQVKRRRNLFTTGRAA